MKILLFGASGTAGGAVLQACMKTPAVEEVRVIVRRPLGQSAGNVAAANLSESRAGGAKLGQFVHADFLDYGSVKEAFAGIDACLFCLGISVMQVSQDEYVKISHDFPIAAAKMLKAESPGAAFHYITGKGTNAASTTFWSKVKGQTENELIELIGADCWRPAYIDAEPSAGMAKTFAMLRPVFRLLKPFPSLYVGGEDLGRAMLQATRENVRGRVIENREIRDLAAKFKDIAV